MSTTTDPDRLLLDDRRARILQDLQRDGRVLSTVLARRYAVSEDAIRRDLRELASQHLLKRVHGGALPVSNAFEPYAVRRVQEPRAKQDVAAAVARWVRPNQVLFLDGGSTLTEVIAHLPAGLNLTVITNNLHAAVALTDRPDIHGVLLGGTIDSASHITSGLRALEDIQAVRADACLLGVCGLHPEHGLTAAHQEEAQLKRAMVRQSAECAVVLTRDKLGTTAPYVVLPAADIDTLFIEPDVSGEQLAPYRQLGIQVLQ
ncbi:DeoR/GlpR family DNA-binding transcription regulator [Deinococcus sonorensis]|uniref:DeoR/GlpR family DNA-binding transcription regulator n=2 Tax=Deinococcus sonorensis TaxID=309891 RepID=A0AAU7U5Z2_9DEIO